MVSSTRLGKTMQHDSYQKKAVKRPRTKRISAKVTPKKMRFETLDKLPVGDEGRLETAYAPRSRSGPEFSRYKEDDEYSSGSGSCTDEYAPDHGVHYEDMIKEIESVKREAEMKIHILVGATHFTKLQVIFGETHSLCGLCERDFGNEKERETSVEQLHANFERQHRAMVGSVAFRQRDECNSRLEQIRYAAGKLNPISGRRCAGSLQDRRLAELRRGKVEALRLQKTDSLRSQKCVACTRSLKGSDFARFLRNVDRRIRLMDSELHVHGDCDVEWNSS